MKKLMSLILSLMIVVMISTGCGKQEKNVTLTMTFATGKNMEPFFKAMKEKFPNVNFDIYCYSGQSPTSFLLNIYRHHDASDIMTYTQKLANDLSRENLLDLTRYEFLNNIDMGMLNQLDVDGHIYQIPGPVTVRSMAYNKTMFDQYGWEEPKSFDDLVALVSQIRTDAPEIIPIAMSMGAVGYPFTTVTTFSQAGFLSSPLGTQWEHEYLKGEASVRQGWEEGFEMLSRLIDVGAFPNAEQWVGKWDNVIIDNFFANGKAALLFVWGSQKYFAEVMENSPYDFELLPFYSLDGENQFIGVNSSIFFGLNKCLAEAGNEEKLKAAVEVMAWIESLEAQTLLLDSSAEIPSLKDTNTETISPKYRALWNKASTVYKAPMLYAGYEDVMVEAGKCIQDYIISGKSEGMTDTVVELVDRIHQEALLTQEPDISYGEFTEKIEKEALVQLIANAINSRHLADFTLISRAEIINGIANKRGISGWVYPGTVGDHELPVMLPAEGNDNIVVLTLTGNAIKKLLQEGKVVSDDNGNSVSFNYYWAGIDVDLKDDVISSVKYDGNELDDNKTYQVAFYDKDYTDRIAQLGNPKDSGITLRALIETYLKEYSPISIPKVKH